MTNECKVYRAGRHRGTGRIGDGLVKEEKANRFDWQDREKKKRGKIGFVQQRLFPPLPARKNKRGRYQLKGIIALEEARKIF